VHDQQLQLGDTPEFRERSKKPVDVTIIRASKRAASRTIHLREHRVHDCDVYLPTLLASFDAIWQY
jgi:hypothetical protein